jgi:hypothetical protein
MQRLGIIFPSFNCHPLSDRICSGIFHLVRQIVSFEGKQLLFNYLSHKEIVKRKTNNWFLQRRRVGLSSTLSGVLGACELGHDLQTREGIKTYFSLYTLGAWELGHNLQIWKGLKT